MPLINTVIPTQNFELVRNRIGEILADELANQFTLGGDNALNVDVYVERAIALAWNQMPAVNILLSRGPQDNQHQGSADGTYVFNIDCHASSPSSADGSGDVLAATNVQKLVGVCRYILEHTAYKTLGFTPGFIGNKKVEEIQFQDPENSQDGTSTARGRITFSVRVTETTNLLTANLIAGYDTVAKLGETEEGYRWSITNSLPAPFGLTAISDPYGVLLLWNYTAGVEELGFNIYRSVGYPAGEYEIIGTSDADVTMFIDEDAPTDQVIFYYVTAFNSIRESNISNIVAVVISSGGTATFDILNDKASAQVILPDASPANNVVTMQATLEVSAGNFTDDVSIPVPGNPLKFRLRDSVGGLFAMTLKPGPGYVEAEDRMYIDFANILFRDEDDPDVNISVIPASTFVVAVYEKTGTTRYTNVITGFAFLPGHLRVWVDEDVIGGDVTVNSVAYPEPDVIVEDTDNTQGGLLVSGHWEIGDNTFRAYNGSVAPENLLETLIVPAFETPVNITLSPV